MTRGGDRRLPDLFAELSGLVLPSVSLADLLGLVVSLALSAVDGVEGASISMVHGDGLRFHTPSASSTTIRSLDEVQYDCGEGPCVEAMRTCREVTVELPTGRWPKFSARAVAEDVLSVTSLPLTAAEHTMGSLNLYSAREPALEPDAARVSRALAHQASVVLTNAAALSLAEMTNQQLRQALETRGLIGQAKGILMAHEGIDAERAFDILRRASQRTNRKLRDVAADMVRSFGATEDTA